MAHAPHRSDDADAPSGEALELKKRILAKLMKVDDPEVLGRIDLLLEQCARARAHTALEQRARDAN